MAMPNEARTPRRISSRAINTLALLGVVYALYVARGLLLPLVLAAVLALLLAPVVIWLQRLYIPRPLAAFLMVAGLAGALVLAVTLLAQPAANWAGRAPQLARELEWELYPLTRKVEEVSQAVQQVEALASVSDQAPANGEGAVRVQSMSLTTMLMRQTRSFLIAMLVVFFLLYFLLASSDRLWRNTLKALPDWRSRRRLVVVTRRLQREISRYLLTFTVINLTLGVVVTAICFAFGVPNPLLWGAVTGALNFIPYLGPTLALGVLTVVSLLSDVQGPAFAVPIAFAVLTTIEGQFVTPTVMGRSLALNPVFVFTGLIFWGWLWGAIGALLAVPLMVSIKIICDNVEGLQGAGRILGR